MAKKVKAIEQRFAVGDLVYIKQANVDGQAAGYHSGMSKFQGKSFLIKTVVPWSSKFAVRLENVPEYFWDIRCLIRLRKAKKVAASVIVKPAPIPAPVKAEKTPEEILLNFRTSFAKEVGLKGVGLCSFAHLYNKTEIYESIRAPCHAMVGRVGYGRVVKSVDELILNIKGHLEGLYENKEEDYKKYVEYILNRSPWSIAFIPESMEDRWNLGVRCNVHLPTEVVKCAAISLREANEFNHRVSFFNRLVRDGCSENTAKLLSACLNKENQDSVVYTGFGNSHQIWWSDFDTQSLFSFFKKGFPESTLNMGSLYKGSAGDYTLAVKQAKRTDIKEKTITEYVRKGLGLGLLVAPAKWGGVVNNNISYKKVIEFGKHLDTVLN